MIEQKTQVLQQCAHGALAGKLTFPEIVGQLSQIGIERYHADYSRQEITYYFPDGESVVIATRQSQRNEHTYIDFIQKTMSAGCVGYFVQITGRRVIYFGRTGESHVEHFPPASADSTSK